MDFTLGKNVALRFFIVSQIALFPAQELIPGRRIPKLQKGMRELRASDSIGKEECEEVDKRGREDGFAPGFGGLSDARPY